MYNYFAKVKILITGTAGFIGFHLAQRLAKDGAEVMGVDNINDYYDVRLKYARLAESGFRRGEIQDNKIIAGVRYPHFHFVKSCLEDIETLDKVFSSFKPDVVCNLAAQAGVRYSLTNPFAYLNSNLSGFLNILEMCRKHKTGHLVYASSSSVYGLNTKYPLSVSDNVDHPVSLYAATKKSNELMAHSYSYLYGIPTTGLRFFTVYGPWGRPDMALFIFTKNIMEGKPVEIFNNGQMVRDFTYIDDIISGVCSVLNSPPLPQTDWNGDSPDPSSSVAPYRLYNIGNSSPVNLLDFISAIEKELGKKAEKIFLPMQPGDVKTTHADISSLQRDFGFKPLTTVDVGVAEFIKWYRYIYMNIKL